VKRREFIKFSAGIPLLLGAGKIGSAFAADTPNSSRLVTAWSAGLFQPDGKPDPAKAKEMFKASFLKYADAKSYKEGWAKFLKREDIVGIKLNCMAGKNLMPNHDILDELVSSLLEAGVEDNNIVIWDRFVTHISRIKYPMNDTGRGIRVMASEVYGPITYTGQGYDKDFVYEGDSEFTKIVTQLCSAHINFTVLKDHGKSGITGALKNFSFGAVNSTIRFHSQGCDPHAAAIWNHEAMKGKVKLNILDAIRPLCEGGPSDSPKYRWNHGAVVISEDPVAVDALGLKWIEARRAEMKLPTFEEDGRPAKHVRSGAKLGLGQDDLSKVTMTDLKV